MNSVNLLLPGFQSHELQASVLNTDPDSTTYGLNCPASLAAEKCGVLGSGMTVIKSPASIQVINVDNHDNTAAVSCAIEGTTYASCHAKETITVQGTLAPKDLNWMQIPLTETPLALSTHKPSLAGASGISSQDILTPDSETHFSFRYHFISLSKSSGLFLFLSMALYFYVRCI